MRVAAYIRVSDESQIEGYSLEAQKTEITRWCERRGHELVAVYSEEGVSAHSERLERRPELMRLLEDGGRVFDLAVVHTLDRWARNVGVQRHALQRLGDAGAGFASVTEDIDFSTPSGRLMLTMIGGVAEFFSDQLAVHVRKGLHERVRQGRANGDIPFGYKRCREDLDCPPDGHPGGVHIIDEEAEALRELFQLYSAGSLTQSDAATSLNMHGFRSRNKRDTGRGAGPQPFTTWSIRDIISNPFYMGVVRWNRTEVFAGKHEPIIDAELFGACQSVRMAHRTRSRTFSPSTRDYLLKGLLRCASCGEGFWTERSGRQQTPYYRGARRSQDCGSCKRSLRTEVVDGRVGLLVYALTLPSDWMARARSRVAASGPSLKARREVLEERRRRLARAYVDSALSVSEYRRELDAIDSELAALAAKPIDETSEAAALLENLESLWCEANVAERSRILSTLVDAIYIDGEGRVVAIAPKPAMVPIFAAIATRPETGVSLTAAVDGMVETGEN